MAEKTVHSPETTMDSKGQEDRLEFAAQPISSDESSGEELVTVEKGYTDVIAELPQEEKKRILRKVDYRLIPILTLLYLVAFVDRSNMDKCIPLLLLPFVSTDRLAARNAKIAGMEKDLKLHGLQYNIAVTTCKHATEFPTQTHADMSITAVSLHQLRCL